MTTLQREHKLAKSCLIFIQNLSPEVKLDFISDILLLIKKDNEPKISKEEYFAGAWDSEQSAEVIIESINSNKGTSTRNIIDLD
jgi:hypothetical protein